MLHPPDICNTNFDNHCFFLGTYGLFSRDSSFGPSASLVSDSRLSFIKHIFQNCQLISCYTTPYYYCHSFNVVRHWHIYIYQCVCLSLTLIIYSTSKLLWISVGTQVILCNHIMILFSYPLLVPYHFKFTGHDTAVVQFHAIYTLRLT
jgi:hypothetical protein